MPFALYLLHLQGSTRTASFKPLRMTSSKVRRLAGWLRIPMVAASVFLLTSLYS